MPVVQRPTIGPILGYTTHQRARIWLRGEALRKGDAFEHVFAVVQIRGEGGVWSPPIFNKMEPHFDWTAVLALTGLEANRRYEYRAGWFSFAGELATVAAAVANDLQWGTDVYGFVTGSADASEPRVLAVGSCRYLLRLLGGSLFDERGDKTFDAIAQLHAQSPFHALLMVGDQIYADDLAQVAPDRRVDEYLARYRDAFGQPHLRRLMSRLPTYMILDDHEIEDNWPQHASGKDRYVRYPHAMHAYQIYQASHSPLFDAREDGRIDGAFSRLWYTFQDGCYDCFMMDCRTERELDVVPRRMVSQEQLDALAHWLRDGSGRVKLIVSSIPVFPDLHRDADDKWGAFPEDRARLLELVRATKLRNVVFVSGDVHCSYVSELRSPADGNFVAYTVVSSSFFWPYPHMRLKQFAFGTPLTGTGEHRYEPRLLSKVHDTDNFARLELRPAGFTATFFDRKGVQLEDVRVSFAAVAPAS